MRRCSLLAVIVACFSLPWTCVPASAQQARVRQADLADITEHARHIVHGRVIEVVEEPHPQYRNIATVRVTLEVIQGLRGAPGRRFSFREFRHFGALRGAVTKQGRAEGYSVGQELVLFLHGESRYGLTSPVGGGQGRFHVWREQSGTRMAVNEAGNRGLFENVAAKAKTRGLSLSAREQRALGQRGPVDLQDLLALAERFPEAKE